MANKPIHAAGGIVVRRGPRPLVAVVQRSKDERWVLPRGKLKRDERAVTGARREVVEETGHRVRVRDFVGGITYRAGGRPKVVQFWHMVAEARPSRDLTKDIVAIEWLPLTAAVRRLSYPLEKVFLANVGRQAIQRRKRRFRSKVRGAAKSKSRRRNSVPAARRGRVRRRT
jgi:8-oxo-dGTP diphosphatase